MDLFTVMQKEEVLALLRDHFQNKELSTEEVAISEAKGRILAGDVVSKENIPSFVRSMVDGYAVKSSNTVGVSESMPVFLKLIGESRMGEACSLAIGEYETVYVPTGGALPQGADGVVMIEYAERHRDEVIVYDPVANLQNTIGIGDDVRTAACVLKKGTPIRSQHIGMLAALGYATVKVYSKPKVSIFSTGDELVDVDVSPQMGQVRDVNGYSIQAFITDMGCHVVRRVRIEDEFSAIKAALDKAVSDSDVVLMSGGSSVGTHDMTSEAINAIGEPGVLVHGVAIKPGKPTIAAKVKETAVFGLPGHPLSCVVALHAVVGPFLESLQRKTPQEAVRIPAKAAFQLHLSSGRDVYLMVRLKKDADRWTAELINGKSGMVSMFAEADGYIEVPMGLEGIEAGDWVEVRLFE